ncbi:efflux RND transporter permease subunit [Corallococcus llansteffanensis]|nr:MMPL family transporter [Corallococcus llansteffanensis]
MMTPRSRVERVAAWMVTHPKTLLFVLLAIIAVSASALPRLKMQAGFEALTDRTLPEQRVLDTVVERFVGDNLIVLAYEADDVFSRPALETVYGLSEDLQGLTIKHPDGAEVRPVARVDSLTHVKDVVGADLSFRAEPLVPQPVPQDAAALAHIRERALFNPLISEGLLSPQDPKLAMVVVRLIPDLSDDDNTATVAKVQALVEKAKATGGVKAFYVTGTPTILAELGAFMQRDLNVFIPALMVSMFVLLLVCLRRLAGAVLAFVNMMVALVAGLAMFPLLGRSMTNWSVIVAPVVLVLSTALLIHFLSELAHHAKEQGGREVVESTLAELLIPATMCEFTTIIGFGSIAVSNMPALRDFGITSALAIVAVFLTTMTMVTLAALWKPPSFWVAPGSLGVSPFFTKWVGRYTAAVQRRPLPILMVSIVLLVLGAAGIPRIYTDSNLQENLGHATPVRAATELVDNRLGGASALVISLKHDKEGHFLEPEALQRVEALEEFLRKDLNAKVVTSPADYIKLMHRGFFGDDPKEYRLPETREQTAQLLLLNGDDSFAEYLDPSRGWARVVVRYNEHSVAKQNVIFDQVDAYLVKHFPASDGYAAVATGDNRMLVNTIDRLVQSQMGSLGLAFILIFGPIFIVLRSVRAGLFSIPSNIWPVIVILGVMGWIGVPLNEATSMIASIALGIVVDDTIHFLEYFRSRLAEHDDRERALRETMLVKGAGVSISTLVFTMGFGVLMLSQFPLVSWFGLLTALAILLGMVSEMLVLPPLLAATRTRLGVPVRTPASHPAGDTVPSLPGTGA